MAAFPLLSLPHLAFEIVYRNMEFIQLIHLSECSKRAKDMVSSVAKYDKNVYCDISVAPMERRIRLFGSTRNEFIWCSHSERKKQTVDVDHFEEHFIDGTSVRVSKVGRELIVVGISDTDLIHWAQHLKDLFRWRETSLSVDPIRKFNFSQVFMQTDVFHRATKITIGAGVLSPEEITFLLDHLTTEHLTFRGFPSESFRYSKPIRFPQLFLHNFSPFERDLLLDMVAEESSPCWHVNLSVDEMTEDFLNQLLKSWLAGRNRTLAYVYINVNTPYRDSTDLDTSKICSGVSWSPGAQKRTGRDIRRGDGLLATFNIAKTDQSKYTIALTIRYRV